MFLAGFRLRHLLTLSFVFAVEAPAAVSLRDAYRSAVEKTEPVALQRSLTEQADDRIDQALGRVFPQVSLLGQYTYQDPVAGGIAAFTRPDQYNVRIGVEQPLFRGFGDWAELRSRRALKAAAEAREKNTRLELYRRVADAYFAVLAEEKDCRNLEEQILLMEKQVRELRQRVAIGRSRIGDRLSTEASAAALRAELLSRRNVLATARETLRAVTGLALEVALVADVATPPAPPPLEPLLAELEKRPDFEAARKEAESALESIAVARAAHWPAIDAFGNYFLARTGPLAGSHWDAGIRFTLPLFQGGAVTAAVSEGVERHKAAELTLAQLRRTAEQELRSAHAAAVIAIAQEQELLEAVKLSKRNYDQQTRDYRNGLVTNLEVLQALETLESTQRSHDRLLHDAQVRRIRLDVAAGKLPDPS